MPEQPHPLQPPPPTVSDHLLDRLAAWGVRRIFGYPGDGVNGVMGALHRAGTGRVGGRFDFVQAAHEELAGLLAVAHAKFTGEVGVCVVTSGPAFPIGRAMNKNLTVQMGNCNHRKYIPHLVELVEGGAVDPRQILTQVEPMTDVLSAYRAFNDRQPGWVKVELKPAA